MFPTECEKRGCKHYLNVRPAEKTEIVGPAVCKAFPYGIPNEIAYGDNPHTTPYPGDHGIQYEAKQ